MPKHVARIALAGLILSGCSAADGMLAGGTGHDPRGTGFIAARSGPTLSPGEDLPESGAGDSLAYLRDAAQMAERTGNARAAAGHWARILEAEPDNVQAGWRLSRALRRMGQPEDAERIARAALRHDPGNAEILAELGKTLIAAGRPAEARPLLEQALARAPDNPDLLTAIGVSDDREGRHEAAQARYAAALAIEENHAGALNNAGLSHAMTGDLDLAKTLLQKALASPDAGIRTRQNLALILSLRGELAAAERLARRDMSRGQAEASVAYFAGIPVVEGE